jgi:hypothetical protein
MTADRPNPPTIIHIPDREMFRARRATMFDLCLEDYRVVFSEQTAALRELIGRRPCSAGPCKVSIQGHPSFLDLPAPMILWAQGIRWAPAVDAPLRGGLRLTVTQTSRFWVWILSCPPLGPSASGPSASSQGEAEGKTQIKARALIPGCAPHFKEFIRVSEPHPSLEELQAALMGELRSLEARLQQHPEWD